MTITMINDTSTDAAVTAWVSALTRNGYVIVCLRAGSTDQARARERDAVLCEMRDDDRAFRHGTNPTGSDHG